MNRVLSLPHTRILPGLLDGLKEVRNRTVVTDKGMIRFDHLLGAVEMRFCDAQQQLPAGTAVYVWWKGGGFVCERVDVVDAAEIKTRSVIEQVRTARAALSAARARRDGVNVKSLVIASRAESQQSRDPVVRSMILG